MSSRWKDELHAAIRKAKIRVVGQYDVKNEAQAKVAQTLVETYGDTPIGFIYIDPTTARSTRRPPDVATCHMDVGLLVIEVKGWSIDYIRRIEAGTFFVFRDGKVRQDNVFQQAQDAMFPIKDAVRRKIGNEGEMPLFDYMVAFPNISESDWNAKGYDRVVPSDQLLFREHIHSVQRLRQRVSNRIAEGLRESRKEKPLDIRQIEAIKLTFGDTEVINERRPPRDWLDKRKLGAYIDELVAIEKYLSPEQQELSRLNVEGYPRLIRGVAGSGKTVVLTNLVARFVNRKLNQSTQPMLEPTSDLRVGVICFNRSLIPFLQRKIGDAYRQQTAEELPPNVVDATHFNGLCWSLGKRGALKYMPIKSDVDTQRVAHYREQLAQVAAQYPTLYQSVLYDAIFVDEGQGLSSDEYLFLLDLVKQNPETGEKTIVIFYDDAQNLYARPRPNWKQVGIDVQRGDRARIMKECFRNTREIVELAFNVLLGSQAHDGSTVRTRTFADVNNLKQLGLVEELGDHFKVRFAERTFRKPEIYTFDTRIEEKQWLIAQITQLIKDENVRSEDILVLFPHREEFADLPGIVESQFKGEHIKGVCSHMVTAMIVITIYFERDI